MTWYRRLSDRRGRLRFELVGDLPAVLGAAERLTVHDINARGASVEAPMPLPAESAQTLWLVSGGVAGQITARVRSVSRSDRADGTESYRIGLEFIDVPQAFREAIERRSKAELPVGAE
jgi:hypothetical protein